jgi:hypothetical protein
MQNVPWLVHRSESQQAGRHVFGLPKNFERTNNLEDEMKLILIALLALTACHKETPTTTQTDKPIELTGYVPDEDFAYRDNTTFITANLDEPIPEKFDVRDLMKQPFPPSKQQQCGDCWAWATHHAGEMVRQLVTGVPTDLSSQVVLSCSHQGSCGGGSMGAVAFLKHGLPTEAEYPYLGGSTGRCKLTDDEINKGWDPKALDTPYVGNSLDYSRAMKTADGYTRKPTVQEIQASIYKFKAPVVATVASFGYEGPGVYSNCSAINDGGNHMIVIPGWDSEGQLNAHVTNSHGPNHGVNGTSRIKWECGAGRLNRGLGVSSRVVIYKPACEPPHVDLGKAEDTITLGHAIKLGTPQPAGVTCQWAPTTGIADPHACVTFAEPTGSTEYHLIAKNNCGTASTMKLLRVLGPVTGTSGEYILTPHGMIVDTE